MRRSAMRHSSARHSAQERRSVALCPDFLCYGGGGGGDAPAPVAAVLAGSGSAALHFGAAPARILAAQGPGMGLFLLSFVHFLVHFCSNNLSFGAGVPCYKLSSGTTGILPGGRNGVPEKGTRGIRVTAVLARQRAF